MVAGEGFEPSKAEPGDLQSPPIGRSGNPPGSNCSGARVPHAGTFNKSNQFHGRNLRNVPQIGHP